MSRRALSKLLGNVLSPRGARGRLAVFCYHQVLETADEFRKGEPTVDEFTRDVELIASTFNALSFDEATTMLAAGTLPKRAACITFDDGYANNHELAAPILERAGVPATFFIAGGAVDDGVMWNDLVIEAIAHGDGSPAVPGAYHCLKIPDNSSDHAAVIADVIAQLKYRPTHERWEISSRLYRDNINSELPRLMMTRELVADLADRGFEVGGHTIKHPILKELSDEDAKREIDDCREWLKTVTGVTPKTFAYPNGRSGVDFDERHQAMVEAAGFTAAASTDWQLASNKTSAYSVPRVGPWWRQGRSLESGLLRAYLRSYF